MSAASSGRVVWPAKFAAPGAAAATALHAFGRARQHQAPGDVDAAGLAGDFFDLLVELDGVLLEFRDVGIAVDRVHAACRMPRRSRGQLIALDEGDITPSCFREVIEDAAADDAATDDGHLHMKRSHSSFL